MADDGALADLGAGIAATVAPTADPPTAAPDAPPADEPAVPAADRAGAAGGGDSATAPSAPSAPAVPPQVQQVQAQYGQLLQLEQQLAAQQAQDQQLAMYGDQLPPALREQIQGRAPAYAIAQEKLAVAKAAAELELQRAMLEGPARVVSEHGWHEQAKAALGDSYDRAQLTSYLANYSDPAAMKAATDQYIDMAKKSMNATRAAKGIDSMGGGGKAASGPDPRASASDDFRQAIAAAYGHR